jgi:hypothetical protein
MICVRPAQAFPTVWIECLSGAPGPNCAGGEPCTTACTTALAPSPLSPPQEHRLMPLTDACRLRGWIPACPHVHLGLAQYPSLPHPSKGWCLNTLLREDTAAALHRHLIVDLRSLFTRYDAWVYSLPRRPADILSIQHPSYIFVHPSPLCSTPQHYPLSLCAPRSGSSSFHPLLFHHHASRRSSDASFQLALPTSQLKGRFTARCPLSITESKRLRIQAVKRPGALQLPAIVSPAAITSTLGALGWLRFNGGLSPCS